jgi:hypothetical protein
MCPGNNPTKTFYIPLQKVKSKCHIKLRDHSVVTILKETRSCSFFVWENDHLTEIHLIEIVFFHLIEIFNN